MDKKKGIIFSLTGIFIVLIALIGFTYGFFASIVSGNETAKKVTLKAGNSEVEYTDLSDYDTEQIIEPGYVNIKFFTVENIGEVSASYYIFLTEVINEFTRKEDIVYTLYRKAGDTTVEPTDVDTTVTDFSDWETVSSGQYPSEKASLITEPEKIQEPGDYYIYAFRVEYINQPSIDQVDDAGNTFSGKIAITSDETGEIPDPYSKGTLAYHILENSKSTKNGTTYRETPLTTPLIESSSSFSVVEPTTYTSTTASTSKYYVYGDIDVSDGSYKLADAQVTTDVSTIIGKYIVSYSGYGTNPETANNYTTYYLNEDYVFSTLYKVGESTTSTKLYYGKVSIEETGSVESTLSVIEDRQGASYYFRGGVEDNYVLFNNMCWRIVRIEGDGSTKLVYAGDVEESATDCTAVGTDTGVLIDENGDKLVARYGNSGEYADYINYQYDEEYDMEYGYIDGYGKGLREEIVKWFNENFSSSIQNKLKKDKWCIGGTKTDVYNMSGEAIDDIYSEYEYYYLSGKRLRIDKTINLTCTNENYDEAKFGILTADEVILAGAVVDSQNKTYYLYDNVQNSSFSTLTLNAYYTDADEVFRVSNDGKLDTSLVYSDNNIRPSITLLAGTFIDDGDGTIDNPYIIR